MGSRFLIPTDGILPGAYESNNLGIAVGDILHHVAPVTPYGAEIEEPETVFFLRALEDRLRPGVPFGGFFRVRDEELEPDGSQQDDCAKRHGLQLQSAGALACGESLNQ